MVDAMLNTLMPIGGQLSFGSAAGYCAGYALRVGGRIAAVGVGSAFILVQSLAYMGYVDVDYNKAERDFEKRKKTDCYVLPLLLPPSFFGASHREGAVPAATHHNRRTFDIYGH